MLRIIEQALKREPWPAAPAEIREFDHRHLQVMTDELAARAEELQATNDRFAALIDLNLRLAAENDPQALLHRVCHGARDLIGAKYAVLAIREEEGAGYAHVCTSGISDAVTGNLPPLEIDDDLFSQVCAAGVPRRFVNFAGTAEGFGLPAGFPPARGGLVAPVRTPDQSFGWILLAGRLMHDSFSDEDERLLSVLGAQLGIALLQANLHKRITEQAASLERRVIERTAQLEATNRDLESFSYSVAHDLSSPLARMSGFAKLLEAGIKAGKFEKLPGYVDRIIRCVASMTGLINGLLDIARASHSELVRERVDLAAMLEQVLDEQNARARASVRIGSLPVVLGDAASLRQVWTNLVSNALKYSAKRDSPEIGIACDIGASEAVFRVRDNGAGFDPNLGARLFSVFQRLHADSEFEGSGVGLAIIRRIIERHGGRVWAEGRPDAGATFYFALPKGIIEAV
jgi:signal transduction histidine kinase